VTKYEELEEAGAELKLKKLLWDSLHQWDVIVAEWMEVSSMLLLSFSALLYLFIYLVPTSSVTSDG